MIWSWRVFWMAGMLSGCWLSSYGIWKSTIQNNIWWVMCNCTILITLTLFKYCWFRWISHGLLGTFLQLVWSAHPASWSKNPSFISYSISLSTYNILDQLSYSPHNAMSPSIASFVFCSNHSAPSQNTRNSFAAQDTMKHIATGGSWLDPYSKKWGQVGRAVLTYVASHPHVTSFLGLNIEKLKPPYIVGHSSHSCQWR